MCQQLGQQRRQKCVNNIFFVPTLSKQTLKSNLKLFVILSCTPLEKELNKVSLEEVTVEIVL